MPLSSNEAHKPCKGHTIATPLQENELHDYIQSVILNKQDTNEPFYVLDLGAIESLMARWTRNLPSIRPFYAVKCNPDPSLLHAMANLGSGFDCASRAEIEAVLSLGVSPDRIIFANPCKPVTHIRYAAEVGVNLTTFDSEFELFKIQKHHPDCGLLIRIKAPDDGDSKFPLGKKFGALPEETEQLLRAAQALKLRVLGVSFHIGSGARRVEAYRTAIKAAKKVFDLASSIGLPRFNLLDIGGGFTDGEQFEIAAYTIKSAIIEHLGDEPGLGLAVIAEPGRYFAESVCTLAANVFGKRLRGELREYWINDGIYGSMNLRFWDETKMNPTPFACMSSPLNATCRGERVYTSTVFGPTCDAADVVLTSCQLPELQVDDWLIFSRMGAYTKASGTNFNGFNIASIIMHTHAPHLSKV